MFAGLCYSEFAAMVPVAGSAYAYSYATLGEFVAWFVGWNLILEYMMACSTVAVGWSRYFIKLLDHYGINFIPAALSSAPFEAGDVGFQVHTTGAFLNLPAIAIIAAATALCYKGIRESAVVNTVIVAIKVSIVIAVIAFGIKFVNVQNWVPYIPKNTGTFGEFGWSGILQASAIIFFAYIGFDGVSTVAQEAKDPQRGMPIGMLGSLAICTVLYILMSSVLTGLVPFKQLNDAAPVAVALESHPQLLWLSSWVIWGALFGLTSVIITMIIPQARIWLTMSHDGLLPKIFGAVHPKFRTPHISTLITGVLAATFAGCLPIGILGELVSIGTLVAFIVVCIGVLVLRYTPPRFETPVPGQVGVVRVDDGRVLLRRHGRVVAQRHLVAARDLERHRDFDLFSIRLPEQPPAHGCHGRGARTRRGAAADQVLKTLRRARLGRQRPDGLEHLLVDLGVAGHDVGPERIFGAARRADAAPGLLDEQDSGGGVPGRQAEFPKAVDAAGRHVGQIQGGGARPAHAGCGGHDDFEHGQVGVEVGALAKRKAGADQRAFQGALRAHAHLFALELRAVAARGGEKFLAHGIVDHGMLQAALLLDRNGHGEGRETVQKIGGAVQGVDDPHEFIVAAAARFLGENRMLRMAAADRRDDVRLGLAVDVGHEVVAALAVDFQRIEPRQAFYD